MNTAIPTLKRSGEHAAFNTSSSTTTNNSSRPRRWSLSARSAGAAPPSQQLLSHYAATSPPPLPVSPPKQQSTPPPLPAMLDSLLSSADATMMTTPTSPQQQRGSATATKLKQGDNMDSRVIRRMNVAMAEMRDEMVSLRREVEILRLREQEWKSDREALLRSNKRLSEDLAAALSSSRSAKLIAQLSPTISATIITQSNSQQQAAAAAAAAHLSPVFKPSAMVMAADNKSASAVTLPNALVSTKTREWAHFDEKSDGSVLITPAALIRTVSDTAAVQPPPALLATLGSPPQSAQSLDTASGTTITTPQQLWASPPFGPVDSSYAALKWDIKRDGDNLIVSALAPSPNTNSRQQQQQSSILKTNGDTTMVSQQPNTADERSKQVDKNIRMLRRLVLIFTKHGVVVSPAGVVDMRQQIRSCIDAAALTSYSSTGVSASTGNLPSDGLGLLADADDLDSAVFTNGRTSPIITPAGIVQ